jgi:hypothetical protein
MNVAEDVGGHSSPDEAIEMGILTAEQYDEYDHYTLIRDPADRFFSAYSLNRGQSQTPLDFYETSPRANVLRPQADYFTRGRVQALPFSDYENSVMTIMQILGVTLSGLPHVKHRVMNTGKRRARMAYDDPSTGLKEKIQEEFADDFLLNFKETDDEFHIRHVGWSRSNTASPIRTNGPASRLD